VVVLLLFSAVQCCAMLLLVVDGNAELFAVVERVPLVFSPDLTRHMHRCHEYCPAGVSVSQPGTTSSTSISVTTEFLP
jgi:hypothetical protein